MPLLLLFPVIYLNSSTGLLSEGDHFATVRYPNTSQTCKYSLIAVCLAPSGENEHLCVSAQKGPWPQRKDRNSAISFPGSPSKLRLLQCPTLLLLDSLLKTQTELEFQTSLGPCVPIGFHSYFGDVSISCDWQITFFSHVSFKFLRQQGPSGCKQTLWCSPREPLSNTKHDPITSGALLKHFS